MFITSQKVLLNQKVTGFLNYLASFLSKDVRNEEINCVAQLLKRMSVVHIKK